MVKIDFYVRCEHGTVRKFHIPTKNFKTGCFKRMVRSNLAELRFNNLLPLGGEAENNNKPVSVRPALVTGDSFLSAWCSAADSQRACSMRPRPACLLDCGLRWRVHPCSVCVHHSCSGASPLDGSPELGSGALQGKTEVEGWQGCLLFWVGRLRSMQPPAQRTARCRPGSLDQASQISRNQVEVEPVNVLNKLKGLCSFSDASAWNC